MDVLIICSIYPPDSSIAAVRPYMFAKHLAKFGHRVTVLRWGTFSAKADPSYAMKDDGIEVISVLGKDSDVEKAERGEYSEPPRTDRFGFLPKKYRKRFAGLYHFLRQPIDTKKEFNDAKEAFELQKKALLKLRDRHFDIVFSTYSRLENAYAGEYAAKLFHAKWIMDFRDPIVRFDHAREFFWNLKAAKIQRYLLEHADLCTAATEGFSEKQLRPYYPTAHIETIYDGYDELDEDDKTEAEENGVLTFCYTGQLYIPQIRPLERFIEILATLCEEERLEHDKLKFIYAGLHSQWIYDSFEKFGMQDILEDHGYISRNDAKNLQKASDVFVALSWNFKHYQGVLSGKLAEGIRAKKQILALIGGDYPMSELYVLQERYHYGFCYEYCRRDTMDEDLRKYILDLYREKTEKHKIAYYPSEELRNAFRYDRLTKKLEGLMLELLQENKLKADHEK